jgi:RNA polymerase sigma-70 factor (ECF subfamily)
MWGRMSPPEREAEVQERFAASFRAHHPEILAYALRRLGERAGAEDVAAETFAIAWRRVDALPADPLPWLFGIARHVIQNDARSRRRRLRVVAHAAEERTRGDSGDPADSVPERTAIFAALRRLTEAEREVLRLAAWEGLDGRRAGVVLGCSRGAFALRLHRARRRLAKELASVEHDAPEDAPATREVAPEEAR